LLLLTGLFYPVFQTNSTQLLTNKLKPWLKPQDVVASYHSYFQDLPFYLQRRIVIVGYGVQELEFGMQHQNMQNWLIADANFPAWWHSQNRIYLFTNIKNYLQLKKTGLQPLYVVFGPYPSKIGIVSNQPLPPIPIQLKATNLEFFKEEGK
jgi:hypothetical protein